MIRAVALTLISSYRSRSTYAGMFQSLTTTKASNAGKYWKRPNVPLLVLGVLLACAEFGGPLGEVST